MRGAPDMDALSTACIAMNLRQIPQDVLANGASARIRTSADVARRAIVLFSTIGVAMGARRQHVIAWLDEHRLTEAIAPFEASLLSDIRPSRKQMIDAGWHVEGLAVLLWALNLVELRRPDQTCDIDELAAVIPPNEHVSVESFIATARLRPNEELAALAEELWKRGSRSPAMTGSGSSEAARIEDAINHHRYIAILWILDPDMIWA